MMKHGGDILVALNTCGLTGDRWLDLSTGIAPEPYPIPEIPAETWQRLPQSAAMNELLTTARAAYGVSEAGAIVAAPGTQSLIQLLPRLRVGAEVRILGPTYSEHAICWRQTARDLRECKDVSELATADVAIVTNPNNPDGRCVRPADIMRLANRLSKEAGLLIVDEAFADVHPELSVAPFAGNPGLIVLRSFGKFYGLAGARLGFAIGCLADIAKLEALLGPWAVPGPSILIGTKALADKKWASLARRRYGDAVTSLDKVLTKAGLEIIGGTKLFRLTNHPAATSIHKHLAGEGVLTRVFENHCTWLRFGLPGTTLNLRRLSEALAGVPELSNSD